MAFCFSTRARQEMAAPIIDFGEWYTCRLWGHRSFPDVSERRGNMDP
ncbi:unnamed protein product [Acanthoscelides obtectus]|uniref:Uncharacterized protein n=1 Tax=Acanthoscelides obtectus TaxID=200917 RepID=A0A9P0JMQ8_ACAOB|nr:unnamed protein product [Acanthoscelides obtectus]CAK1639669.1 hypothetical protein AOBTE_LOCUS11305 [Acanthoscelides obtectus]